MARQRRRRSRGATPRTLASGAAVLIALAAAWSAKAATSPTASPARSFSVKDEGYLRLVKSSGSLLIDEGAVHGTIPGKVKVRFVYNGNPAVTAQITIYSHAGTILARGSGHLSSPTSASPSFSGTLTIAGGSGRYLHARGGGRLYGVFYRRSYAMMVQTDGSLHY
jgi:hypothetical protein